MIRPVLPLALGAILIVACTDSSVAPNARPKYKIVTSKDTIFVGETLDLVTTPVGNSSGHVCGNIINKKLNFSSSDASVIVVAPTGRQVLGIGVGTASVAVGAPCNTLTEPKALTVINR